MIGPSQDVAELRGSEKAAALLMTLPPEASASVMRLLSDVHVERITRNMIHRQVLAPEASEAILREAHELTDSHHMVRGGVEYARGILRRALGEEQAEELVNRLLVAMQERPFHYLDSVEPAQVAGFLQSEHPQTIALILSYLDVQHAATILSLLPYELQAQVSMRLANLDSINPAIVAQVEGALKKRLSGVLAVDHSKTGGIDFVVDVLTQLDRSAERSILEQLEDIAPELAGDIKRRLFVFQNLTSLDDRSIQRILRDVDSRDLALALRGASPDLRERIFKNVSQRAAEMLRDELESGPPVRLRTVEEAQQKIVSVVRRLEEEEEIVVARGGSDVML